MPLVKNPIQLLTTTTIGAGTRSAIATRADLREAVQCAVTVQAVYTAGATVPAVVEIYSSLAPASAIADTTPFLSGTLPLKPGETVQASFDVPASVGAIGVSVYNGDPTENLEDCIVYALVQDAS